MFNLICSHIITFIIGGILGMTLTCCCVISGRTDEQLGIEDREE
jgi:hypothetical protein